MHPTPGLSSPEGGKTNKTAWGAPAEREALHSRLPKTATPCALISRSPSGAAARRPSDDAAVPRVRAPPGRPPPDPSNRQPNPA
eukprot:3211541-Prymnesium_polylepis.1